MIGIRVSGSFNKTISSLKNSMSDSIFSDLNRYGQLGVDALSKATPVESGETARSWRYEIRTTRRGISLIWLNDHVNDGVNIALLIQYGHGTGTGGYVAGYDYINPALRPIFDSIATEVWEKVKNG